MDGVRMVPLTTSRSGFEAKVVAARLGAEGILWQLRGNVDGMYPLGVVEVLVAEDELAEARELLSCGDVLDEEDLASIPPASARTSSEWWFAALLVLGVGAFVALRLLAMT